MLLHTESGIGTLSPVLMLLSSPHIIGSPNRYSATGQQLQPFRDLKLMFPDSRRAEQCIVATLEDSILRTEITGLDSQVGDPLVVYYESMKRKLI
jgi:hypothetical protein